MSVGVLSIQGSFAEHLSMCKKINLEPVMVRDLLTLRSVTHLILPGGESTTMLKLLKDSGMWDVLVERVKNKEIKIFGTCAGAILCSYLGMEIEVQRNGYGSQQSSCVTTLKSDLFPDLKAAFIRAPKFIKYSEKVEPLAFFNKEAVLLKQDNFLVASFHPELVDETRVYDFFLKN